MEPESSGSKREQAYQRLRRLLILQQVTPGSRLSEPAWTQKLGVNRSALREAFARLAAEGLIRTGPKTGYFVPQLTHEDIYEVLAVRVMLECGAVEIICGEKLNTPEHLEPMRHACEQLERLANEGYPLSVAEADWRFHESIIKAANNRRLAQVYYHAPLPIIFPEVVHGPEWEANVLRTFQEHHDILTALLEGQGEAAKTLLRRHLTERTMQVITENKSQP